MVEGGHRKAGHILGVHVSNGRGCPAHPHGLAFQHRNRKLADQALHEGHTPQDREVEIGSLQPLFRTGLDMHQRHLRIGLGIEEGMKHQPLHTSLLAGRKQVLLPGPINLVGTAGVRGPGRRRINHRLLPLKGVIQTFWLE